MTIQFRHKCEFCGVSFKPRSQVKKPRACAQPVCQKKRQRSNELACRQKDGPQRDSDYHRVCKAVRLQKLKEISKRVTACIHTGAIYLKEKVLDEFLQDFFLQFLIGVGIRKVNKFWPENSKLHPGVI